MASHPQSESVQVPTDVRPWIRLNEYPARSSVEDAIFISPEPDEGFEIKIRGKRIQVRFKEELPENSTVVVTFGSGIQDIHGNQMPESFVMAFSTGDKIDKSGISGYLKGMKNPASTWIWAYPLESAEEPDPREDKAPYATQPDPEGKFRLAFLPTAEYRIFAVEDSRKNRIWDSDREAIAFPPWDVLSAELDVPEINLMMATYDLQPPNLRGAQALHRQAVRFSFDEPVKTTDLEIEATNQDGRRLDIVDAYQNLADSTTLFLTTAIQREGDVYSIRLDGLSDYSDNRADSIIAEVEASNSMDTTGARFAWSEPSDGQTSVDLESSVSVGFNEAITLIDLPKAVTLLDPDSAAVPGKWNYPGSSWGVFVPAEAFASNATYSVRIVGDSLRDIFGNTSPDSLVRLSFTTIDLEELGSIQGRVEESSSDLRVVAERLEREEQWEVAVQDDGSYRFERLPASNYRLWLYRDIDGNGKLSPGKITPFRFAEPFTVSEDTIRVRARWETEGKKIHWNQSPAFPKREEAEP